MRIKDDIQKAVCDYFNVNANEVYTSRSSKYPIGVAKKVLIYLLFVNNHSAEYIAELFNFAPTMVYRHCNDIKIELELESSKIKEDIEKIDNQLNKKY